MFKHILLPTDGSAASERAVLATVRFAKEIGAKITGLHIVPEYHVFTFEPVQLEETPIDYIKDAEERAKKILFPVEEAAKLAGVPCETLYVISDAVHEAILRTAADKQCDLVSMASHGRRGVSALLLGSETQKVLTHSQIPVLVFR
jgi:nucleotide-binding universal stress UspA family protein